MRIDAKQPEAVYYVVVDLDAKRLIEFCLWADDSSGKYCVYDGTEDGSDNPLIKLGNEGNPIFIEKQGSIKLYDMRIEEDVVAMRRVCEEGKALACRRIIDPC